MNPFPAFVIFISGAMIWRAWQLSDAGILALMPVFLFIGSALIPRGPAD